MRIVPAEPTEMMVLAHDVAHASADAVFAEPDQVYRAMVANSPSAGRVPREAVERVARAIGAAGELPEIRDAWQCTKGAKRSLKRKSDHDLVDRSKDRDRAAAVAAITALGLEIEPDV